MRKSISGFTIVELLVVITVIAVLASISIVSYRGIQLRARDSSRIQKATQIAEALDIYRVKNGQYPAIPDGSGIESGCGSPSQNWGHCDRMKTLADALAPYMTIDPTSLSSATQGNYYYYYQSPASDGYQTYGLMVYLEGDSGGDDGGYYANAFEAGDNPKYCKLTYTSTNANWQYRTDPTDRCWGGN